MTRNIRNININPFRKRMKMFMGFNGILGSKVFVDGMIVPDPNKQYFVFILLAMGMAVIAGTLIIMMLGDRKVNVLKGSRAKLQDKIRAEIEKQQHAEQEKQYHLDMVGKYLAASEKNDRRIAYLS